MKDLEKQKAEIRNNAVIKDFVRTTKPEQAYNEILKFLEAANVVFTTRQHVIFHSLVVHYKNLCTTRINREIQKKGDEIYKLEVQLGKKKPN